MTDYNPYYDNTLNGNYGMMGRQQNLQANFQRPLQMGARSILNQEAITRKEEVATSLLNQVINRYIDDKQNKKRQEREAQWEYERKIQAEEVVYLQQSKRIVDKRKINFANNQHSQDKVDQGTVNLNERRPILNHSRVKQDEDNKLEIQGGVFANVFQMKDMKQQQRQQEQQQYAAEIQRQIEEKRQKKEDDAKRKYEEDIRYEEQVKKDMEDLRQRFLKEDQKKQQEIKSLQIVQEQRRQEQQNKELERIKKPRHHNNKSRSKSKNKNNNQQNESNQNNNNNINNNNTEMYSKFLQDETQQENYPPQGEGDQTIHLGGVSQQNIIPNYLLDDENQEQQQQPYWKESLPLSRRSTQHNQNKHDYQQEQQYQDQQYQQQQLPNNQQYQQTNQKYQLAPTKELVSMEYYIQQYEEVLTKNRMKQREQQDEMQIIRQQLDQQANILNDELRILKVQEQVSLESKRNAFQELEYLKDELKRFSKRQKSNRIFNRLNNTFLECNNNQHIRQEIKGNKSEKTIHLIRNNYQGNYNVSQTASQQYRDKPQQRKQTSQNVRSLEDVNLGHDQQFVSLNSGARMMGIPSLMDNQIDSRLIEFEQTKRLESNIQSL